MGEVQGGPLTAQQSTDARPAGGPAGAPPTPGSATPIRSAATSERRRGGRLLWPGLAVPGTAWLLLLLVVPFYSIAAVAFGYRDELFGSPVPEWNPWYWDPTTFVEALRSATTGDLRPVFVRTLVFVALALLICVLIGYPIAYYLARHAGRYRGLLLGLILAPWWINYLTRMLAWLSLLQDDGYINDTLSFLHLPTVQWLGGRPYTVIFALVYGYVPFIIVPLYATLDRIDARLLDASRDLGVGGVRTFLHVTLPLSRPGLVTACVVTALPMFGDYYTNSLVSGSPTTTMIGNQIELYLLGGSRQALGASLVLIMSAMLMVLMVYYLISSQRADRSVS